MIRTNYYFEDLGDSFEFGKYKGELLCDIIASAPSYIYYCINNIPDFTISVKVLDEIQQLFPEFIITEQFGKHIGNLNLNLYDDEEVEDDEEPTYSRYAGTYAQDIMGYSDDDIDTIFDGEPDAYWNID